MESCESPGRSYDIEITASFSLHLKSERGFSLIELTIDVAIIGDLHDGKSFFAENITYTDCLYESVYLPEGAPRFYLSGFITAVMALGTGTDFGLGEALQFWRDSLERTTGSERWSFSNELLGEPSNGGCPQMSPSIFNDLVIKVAVFWTGCC